MVDPQASRFWQSALQSGLIDAEGLTACFEALPPEKRTADQLDRRLARQAVQSGLVTLWQAQQLLSGRSTGFKIDRYVLLEMIGQGGMGRVYLAKDSRLNRRVALKILSPERVNNPRAIARFQREARVGAQLQHEHLVRIYDEGESGGKCYLVMEYIEGKNIGTIIAENGPMPPSTAARLVRQVALGLEHAQLKGLIHRDVNPYNILVTLEGTAKLTDLGLAIDLAEQIPVTRDGATVGTFDYVSPEQARHSHSVDTRSDIYSLGCTIYHMIAGQVPFPSPSLPEKLFGHQAVEPEPLSTFAAGIPEGLVAVIRKMMNKSPDDRYPNPLEVAQALEPFIDDQATSFQNGAAFTYAHRTRVTQTETKITVPRRDATPPPTQLGTPPSTPSSGGESPASPAALPPELLTIGGEPAPAANDLADLGLALNLGPEPALSEGTSQAKPKPKPKSRPKPAEAASAPAPEATGSANPGAPAEELPDFLKIGGEGKPSDDFAGLGLALNLGTEAPPAPNTARPKPSTTPAEPAPPPPKVEPAPTARAPTAEPKSRPAPKRAEPPAETVPDFSKIGGESPAPPEDLTGLGFALSLGTEPAGPTKPAMAPAPKTKPAESAAAPAPAAKPSKSQAPTETVPDFSLFGSPQPPVDEASGLGLGLNLGAPAPSSAAASKANPTLPTPAPAVQTPTPVVKRASPIDRRLVFGGTAALLAVALGLGLFASGIFGQPNKSNPTKKPKADPDAAASSSSKGDSDVAVATTSQKKPGPAAPEVPSGEPIAVKTPDGEVIIEPNLKEAMQRAIGSRGHVLLNKSEPIRLSGEDAAISIGGKSLYVRAAAGVRPVLEVELKGKLPFLTTRGDAPITIVGVTIVVNYADQTDPLPPLIEAGGPVKLERCAFVAKGKTKGSRAIAAEGGTIEATGCWFEGFDQTVDVAVFRPLPMQLKQCMIIRSKPDDQSLGWAIRLRHNPGEYLKTGRRLILDHCTVKGKGLLNLVGFSSENPIKVEIRNSAVQADALVAWESPPSSPLTPEALGWKGEGNQYDVRGKSWVVLSPQGTPELADGPTDLASWSKVGAETATVPPPVKFQNENASPPEPKDFAIQGDSAGADPKQVGPGA